MEPTGSSPGLEKGEREGNTKDVLSSSKTLRINRRRFRSFPHGARVDQRMGRETGICFGTSM